ncbi:MAG: hypothetical protein GXY84_03890 [Clostridiales bacterium]|nr:hypothetical protein [Clostridiales bacterium]
MAGQLWVREIRRNKIRRDVVVPCPDGDWQQAMAAACRELDIAVPLVVARHLRDFEDYRQLRFLPEHFLESVPFDRLEVEFFDPEDRKG